MPIAPDGQGILYLLSILLMVAKLSVQGYKKDTYD